MLGARCLVPGDDGGAGACLRIAIAWLKNELFQSI